MARERGLDLVEVAPNAMPPVCRLMDYGKFRYEQSRKERESRRHQHVIELKEVRIRPKIDDHDLETKGRQAAKFLNAGDKVKLTVLFRGREMAHREREREKEGSRAREQVDNQTTEDENPQRRQEAVQDHRDRQDHAREGDEESLPAQEGAAREATV